MSESSPNWYYEASLNGSVCGVDEAGRGPLAGPVVAAAVILDTKNVPKGLNDSKILSLAQREALFDTIVKTALFGVGLAEPEEIDRVNILGASMIAMQRAVKAYVRDGFLPVEVLARAGRRETDDRLPAIVAGIKGAKPDMTLQAICDRLETMRERTPRGRSKWQPSSVKMLLERAEKLGLLD